jgi:hypothetical protein
VGVFGPLLDDRFAQLSDLFDGHLLRLIRVEAASDLLPEAAHQ